VELLDTRTVSLLFAMAMGELFCFIFVTLLISFKDSEMFDCMCEKVGT